MKQYLLSYLRRQDLQLSQRSKSLDTDFVICLIEPYYTCPMPETYRDKNNYYSMIECEQCELWVCQDLEYILSFIPTVLVCHFS